MSNLEPRVSAPPKATEIATGVSLIALERERQQSVEGWTPNHDQDHRYGEMGVAAACYAVEGTDASVQYPDGDNKGWPWSPDSWKPKDRIRNLVRAGALIAAEIDRELSLATDRAVEPPAAAQPAERHEPESWTIDCADQVVRGQVCGIATSIGPADCIRLLTMPIARMISRAANRVHCGLCGSDDALIPSGRFHKQCVDIARAGSVEANEEIARKIVDRIIRFLPFHGEGITGKSCKANATKDVLAVLNSRVCADQPTTNQPAETPGARGKSEWQPIETVDGERGLNTARCKTAYEVALAILNRLAGEWGNPETAMNYVIEVADVLREESPAIPLWQDIETVPRDDTDILLVWADGHQQIDRMTSGESSFWYENAPTHWMPLPDPPLTQR